MGNFLNRSILTSLLIGFILLGCTSQRTVVHSGELANGRYDSEFPAASISESLDNISRSVKKLDCLAFYATYSFDADEQVRPEILTEEFILKNHSRKQISNESVSGTATVIYHQNDLVGLLTCAHVVDFPDTLYTWDEDVSGVLSSVSILVKLQLFVVELPDGDPVELVAMDEKKDIALLSKRINPSGSIVNVLQYPIGKTSLFEWGSVVYIVGYPLGNLMVTRALVSNPKKNSGGQFLTDALFNRGISGSPVFAIKDGVPNLEWVGMASATSAYDLTMLKPDKESENKPIFNNPYKGSLYLEKVKMINYGVTYSVSIEEIVTFIRQNNHKLERKGFVIEAFYQ